MIAKYDFKVIQYDELKNNVTVPKFQRNFIWKQKARNELIESLKNGLPIGMFLLQECSNGSYNIIDGRQRMTTLKDYENHGYKYVTESDFEDSNIEEALSQVSEVKAAYDSLDEKSRTDFLDKVKRFILDKIHKGGGKTEGISYNKIASYICKQLQIRMKRDDDRLVQEITKLIDEHICIITLANISLPCIIFNESATESDIETAFLNLNSKGVKLSKYDLYSASWQNKIVKVDDDDILEKVISRYNDSLEENQDIETEGFNETGIRDSKEINFFEYADALSRLICDNCGLIKTAKNANEVSSIGFSILAGIVGVRFSDMICLPDKLAKKRVDYKGLKNKIIDCAKKIEETLKFYCISPSGADYFNHSYNQIVTYIVIVFKTLYKIDKDGKVVDNPSTRSKIDDFYRNLPLWYLYENISGFWAGTGDKKADDLMIEKAPGDTKYFMKVDKARFESVLEEWMKSKNEDASSSVSPESKLFINYLIKRSCGNEPNNRQMDIEHIITKAKLQRMARATHRKVNGISSPANLTLLPGNDNRSKRERTYYEALDAKDGTVMKLSDDKLERYIYPKRDEIRFAESEDGLTIDNYENFKNKRGKILIEKFMSIYYS